MILTDEDVAEFAAIMATEFSIELTPDEARIQATLFLELCYLIVQPLSGEPGYAGQPLITL